MKISGLAILLPVIGLAWINIICNSSTQKKFV